MTHLTFTRRLSQTVFALTLLSLIGWAGCDLLDPSNVTNPDTTQDVVLDLPQLAEPWLRGLERQTALAYNDLVTTAELSSDNYDNTNNFYTPDDDLDYLNDQSSAVEDLQFSLADLRESAIFGLTTIRERDENTTGAQVAEFHFFQGLAHLLSGMYFKTLPAEDNGPPVTSAAQLQLAVESFDAALAMGAGSEAKVSYHLGKARAYYYLGDVANAVLAADAAIAADAGGDYVRFVFFDGANNDAFTVNTMQSAVHDRSTDDLQPLPRLDFLDPKYWEYNKTGDTEDDIPMFKIEEAYLIKAEAALAGGTVAEARAAMQRTLGVVAGRPLAPLVDASEKRSENNPGSRPASPEWVVRASPDDTFRSGLFRTRGVADVEIEIPIVSETSVGEAMISAATTVDAALELVYLMRQEIFIAEGIRMADLGIKWPVHENEAKFNPAVTAEDRQPFIPDYLPSPISRIDAFDLDEATKEVTILINLNRVLVENRTSDAVVPFF